MYIEPVEPRLSNMVKIWARDMCSPREFAKERMTLSETSAAKVNHFSSRSQESEPGFCTASRSEGSAARTRWASRCIRPDREAARRLGRSEEARRKVKLDLILDDIAKAEKVEVSEEDMSNFLHSYAMQTRRSPDEIVKELQQDRGRVLDIQRNILRSKAVGRVVELAEISETNSQS